MTSSEQITLVEKFPIYLLSTDFPVFNIVVTTLVVTSCLRSESAQSTLVS